MSEETVTLYYAPQTRASATLALLEELDAPYRLHILNLKVGEQLQNDYLAVNPMGKVPAIRHRGETVTEQVAIFIYLSETFRDAGLAPRPGESGRGRFLRWMAFYGACFEPALMDRAAGRTPLPRGMSPCADFDTVCAMIARQLSSAPYLLGDRLSAADILWGAALRWGEHRKLVPENATLALYSDRICSRPGFARVAALDADLLPAHEAAAQGLAR